MADNTLHVGDVGAVLWILPKKSATEELDPSDASKARLFIQRKVKTDILEVTPTVDTDTFDGKKKFKYVTVAGDLNIAGDFIIQLYCEFTDGIFHSSQYTFTVSSNLRDAPLT